MTHNQNLIQKFLDHCKANGLGNRRIQKYAFHLKKIDELLNLPFEKAKKPELEALMAKIESSSYAEWTKHDFKIAIKKFWKWLKQCEEGYPPEVRWLKATLKHHQKKLPDEILTPDEIKRLIGAARTVRDKALISVLYESGCRIGELMGLKIKHVQFNDHGAVIHVFGKTGSRRVLLIDSVPHISTWLGVHPSREIPESPLWVDNIRNGLLHYESIAKIIRVAAKKANVSKRVNPHSFRHARATHLAKVFTEAQMKEYFGWVQSSDMANVYVHLSGRDVDEAILAMHGIKERNHTDQKEAPQAKAEMPHENECPSSPTQCQHCNSLVDFPQKETTGEISLLHAIENVFEAWMERKLEQVVQQYFLKRASHAP